ncbi:alpha/beta hydrolase [Alcanivorax sediminis]|uniref:Alpha/beta hydrolase fold domain-containing protein n=2 Tax=Alcanivorax sediminis TaxID=2663008 RepID=A0A6N7LSA8_9GAMM|nr:alpha/beta hydrolase [Alcanivorax sediminis]MQX52044.1 alpha/beta hydrolase fold domain-containing protein [Alcanivorax sediminis]
MSPVALERVALKSLMLLPRPVLSRLAAGVETRGRDHLDPHMRFLLALSSAKPTLNSASVPEARKLYQDMIALMDVAEQSLPVVVDHQVPVEGDASILVRRYRPENAPRLAPAILFFHGGGFTVGGVEEYDRLCRYIAVHTNAVVLSVDYRLAPEHPSPTGANDGLAAWRWLLDNTAALGLDPDRLAVMGDSAGGNLSAVVSQQARLAGLPVPALQVLIYPTTDAELKHPSVQSLGQGFGLDLPLLTWFRSHFITDPAMMEDYRLSPLRNPDLADLPPAILVTATDPLRDEGLEYGDKLRRAGVDVTSLDYPQLVHGFITMGGVIPAARKAVDAICDATARQLKASRV